MTTPRGRGRRRVKPTYDDKFRASAVVMLKSQGYPDVKGALTIVANHLKVPARTLSRWFNGESNPPPDSSVKEKVFDMRAAIDAELKAIVRDMPAARADATYRELGTVFGVLFDKARLLDGLPTEIVSVLPDLIDDLESLGINPVEAMRQMRDKAHAERERQHVQ